MFTEVQISPCVATNVYHHALTQTPSRHVVSKTVGTRLGARSPLHNKGVARPRGWLFFVQENEILLQGNDYCECLKFIFIICCFRKFSEISVIPTPQIPFVFERVISKFHLVFLFFPFLPRTDRFEGGVSGRCHFQSWQCRVICFKMVACKKKSWGSASMRVSTQEFRE